MCDPLLSIALLMPLVWSSATRIVMLAVKPQMRGELYEMLHDAEFKMSTRLVISVLAAITHEQLTTEV